jgi:hypothetical protein
VGAANPRSQRRPLRRGHCRFTHGLQDCGFGSRVQSQLHVLEPTFFFAGSGSEPRGHRPTPWPTPQRLAAQQQQPAGREAGAGRGRGSSTPAPAPPLKKANTRGLCRASACVGTYVTHTRGLYRASRVCLRLSAILSRWPLFGRAAPGE